MTAVIGVCGTCGWDAILEDSGLCWYCDILAAMPLRPDPVVFGDTRRVPHPPVLPAQPRVPLAVMAPWLVALLLVLAAVVDTPLWQWFTVAAWVVLIAGIWLLAGAASGGRR